MKATAHNQGFGYVDNALFFLPAACGRCQFHASLFLPSRGSNAQINHHRAEIISLSDVKQTH